MTITRLLAAASLVFVCSVHSAVAQLRAELVAKGLSLPVGFVQDPSQPNVQVVLQQAGRIRVLHNGVVLEQDYLDLTGQVMHSGERGLLGLAFAPDYATSGRVYVSFTNLLGHTVVARFLRDATDPLRADPASRFDLLWSDGLPFLQQPFEHHKAGNMIFGPDGYLYFGVGDGGGENDPLHLAQDPSSLLGKVLRLDVSVDAAHPSGYVVPPNNPFVGRPDVRGEIWSFGFRNPWRWSFDDPARGGTGAMIIADVGQAGWEEVNYEPAGAGGRNYGWRNREGAHDNVIALPPFSALTEPIFEYSHGTGRSITGGFVYRGSALGVLYTGRYFYADFIKSRVWSLGLVIDPATGEATAVDIVEHTSELGTGAKNIASFGVDSNGELYVVSYGRGEIYRVAAPGDSVVAPPPPPPISGCETVQPDSGWTCANGNWYPPGMSIPGEPAPPADPEPPATPPADPPAAPPTDPPSTPPATPPAAGCTTLQPGPDWACANGNWYPPGMTVPEGEAPAPPASTPPIDPPPTTGNPVLPVVPPVLPPSVCPSLQPGPDWTCANGNWYPAGMTIPDGAPPASPEPPISPEPPATSPETPATPPISPMLPPDTSTCIGPDPFAEMLGLIGSCVDGNWIPIEVLKGAATVEFSTVEGGYWALRLDDGRIYAVDGLPAGYLVHGLQVIVVARFKEGVFSVYGPILELFSIAALN